MKLEELIIGSFVNFVRDETDVGGTPVSASFKPGSGDASWSELGCVTAFRPQLDTQEFAVMCPAAGGGYRRSRKTMTTSDTMVFDVDKTSPIFWELLTGVSAAIADTTNQIPFVKSERKIEGWLQFQGRGDDGDDRVIIDMWVELRLTDGTEFGPNPVRPVWNAEVLTSALNNLLPDSIVS